MKRRNEGNQGETSWDIEKWTKTTLFQGENSVFVNRQTKKQTEKKGLGPTAPKHTCRVASTQAEEENAEKSKTQKEERAFAKEPLTNLEKRCRKMSKQEHRKTRKNHPHRSRKQISGSGPNRTKPRRRCKFENAPKTSKIGPRPGKMGKTSISKSPRFCSPRPFFAFQNQFGQKFELPKKQICETPKKLRQKWTATWRRYNRSNAIQPGPATQNCSETPCFEAFRVPLPLGLRLEEPRPETHAKNENLFGPKKTTSTTSKMAFLKNPKNPKTVRIFGFRTPQKKPFRAIKTVVSKRGAANWP